MSMTRFTRQLNRIRYYVTNTLAMGIPDAWYRRRGRSLLAAVTEAEMAQLADRLVYYNRLDSPFSLPGDALRSADLHWTGQTTYFFDLNAVLRYFPRDRRVAYVFGDVTQVPAVPSFVKSRPIAGDNRNAVLLRLNQIRHFIFIHDPIPFRRKKDRLVWRGKAKRQPQRLALLANYQNHPRCDVGDTGPDRRGRPTWRPFMSIRDQLRHKFVLSLEGNDVGTNLKWIMSSNSLCLTTRLHYETWFMEGRLVAGRHFVQLEDDLDDLDERICYYLGHPDEAEAIIREAQAYVAQFLDPERERLLSLLVAQKYFQLQDVQPSGPRASIPPGELPSATQ